jgi:hypothetical protein
MAIAGCMCCCCERDGKSTESVAAKAELIDLCEKFGSEAYDISKKHRHSIKQMSKSTPELEAAVEELEVSVTNTVKVIQLAQEIIDVQRKAARAAKDSDYDTSIQFAALEARLLTLHKKTLSRFATGEAMPSTDALVNSLAGIQSVEAIRLLIICVRYRTEFICSR